MEKARASLKPHANNDPVKYMILQELSDSHIDENIAHQVHATVAYLNPPPMYTDKVCY